MPADKSRKRKSPGQGPSASPVESPAAGSNTFSTRLTDAQTEVVTKAAEARSWTPSNLIRVAALEKAAHILNTAKPTKFDIRGVARAVAEQLCEPSTQLECRDANTGNLVAEQDIEFPQEFDYSCSTSSFTWGQVERLRTAAKLGGTEFLNLVIEECEARTHKYRQDLPDPVEPE